MKLIFGLTLICCNAWATKTSTCDVNLMEDILIKFKTKLKTGDEKLGLPVIDPYRADQLDINLNEDIINLKATLKKISIDGLSEYDIIKANIKRNMSQHIYSTIIHLSWPLVVVSTNYSANGNADVLEIYGKGQMNISTHYFAFETHIDFIVDDGYLKIRDMKLNLSLKSLDFQATGIYNDDELSKVMSNVISDIAPRFINNETIVNIVKQIVRKKLDSFLSSITLLRLLKLLT